MSTTHVSTEAFDLAAQAAHIRSIIKVGVKTINAPVGQFWRTYKGILKVQEPDTDFTDAEGFRHQFKGRRYTKTLSVERLSAGDALQDAVRAREDYARIGQLP